MKKLFNLFFKDENKIRLQKSQEIGVYIVKKGFSILYIGTKEKCQTYMNQARVTY